MTDNLPHVVAGSVAEVTRCPSIPLDNCLCPSMGQHIFLREIIKIEMANCKMHWTFASEYLSPAVFPSQFGVPPEHNHCSPRLRVRACTCKISSVIYLSTYLPIYLSIYLSICVSFHLLVLCGPNHVLALSQLARSTFTILSSALMRRRLMHGYMFCCRPPPPLSRPRPLQPCIAKEI